MGEEDPSEKTGVVPEPGPERTGAGGSTPGEVARRVLAVAGAVAAIWAALGLVAWHSAE